MVSVEGRCYEKWIGGDVFIPVLNGYLWDESGSGGDCVTTPTTQSVAADVKPFTAFKVFLEIKLQM